ncbi:MAG: tRNA (N(6)-L-threonylcarbamoyladenosine(37)-C(2))-methylthiotransferase MtaB [Chloroflexota bacterium]|nr:tRNA (N(6)-L-threonylcarbamoyladenosine(37)-C(2))-methylthiotransferase MtaB [Chloroflexota bacterium]
MIPVVDAPTVAILTLGCKLNQADSQALARQLLARGCRIVDRASPAAQTGGRPPDAYVVNTCSVTHVADRKSRHLVRLARRLSPQATVVLAGCYAESAGPDLAQRLGADIVVANADKPALAARLLAHLHGGGQGSRVALASGFLLPPPKGGGIEVPIDAPAFSAIRRGGVRMADRRGPGTNPSTIAPADALRTRAFVKIQEGCNEVCAFCIVPRTRGRERSVPVADVVAQVRARHQEGAKEVVLTGTQLGNYGHDLGLTDGPRYLLAALLAHPDLSGPRLRLSSLQAQDINEDLLRLWQDRRLCRHFHLPLQSGSDRILAAMRRRYSVDQYRRALALIREHVPDVAVTTDVIVGFPGESEDDFQRTYHLCQELGFAAVHVFPYSRRPGTAASLLKEQVPAAIKRQRLERMLALAHTSAAAFRARFRGRTLAVLWEEARAVPERSEEPALSLVEGQPLWRGLTDNYLRVYTCAEHGSPLAPGPQPDLTNRLLPARLGDAFGDGLWADLAN